MYNCEGCSVVYEGFNVCDDIRESNVVCPCSVCIIKSMCQEDCELFIILKRKVRVKASTLEIAFSTHKSKIHFKIEVTL